MNVQPFDDAAFRWLNGGLGPWADRVVPVIADAHTIVPWLAVAGLIAATVGGRRWRRTLLLAGLVVAITDPANRFLVKRLLARDRPCQILHGVVVRASHCPRSGSFPSSHAVNSTAVATVVALEHPALAIPLAALVAVTALSRVYQGVHFPLDVLGGLILGGGFGFVAVHLARGPTGRRARRFAHAAKRRALHAWQALGERRWRVAFGALLVASTAFSVVAIATGGLDLAADEAHYWEWSRRLDLSYYSKGPGIAWLIRATTAVFGDSPLGIRMSAVLSSVVLAIAVFVLARRVTGSERRAVLALVLLRLSPLFAAGGMIATIDPPFAACWVLAMVAVERAFRTGSTAAWLAAGAATGVGFLFKYTAGVLVPCVVGAVVLVPELRHHLRRPGPYLGALLAAALTLPVWIWNARHGWVTTAHVGKLVGVGHGTSFDVGQMLEYVGSQLGVLTPWVTVFVVWGMVHAGRVAWRTRDPGWVLLFATSAPVIVFFALKSGQAKVQANWAAPAYVGAAIAAAVVLDELFARVRGRDRRALRRLAALCVTMSIALSLLMSNAGLTRELFAGFPARSDPTARLRGWHSLGRHVGELLSEWRREGASPLLFANQYAKASALAYYVPGHPRVYSLRLERRYEQYDIWNDLAQVPAGADALYVGGSGGLHPAVALAFGSCAEVAPFVDATGNSLLGTQHIYRCAGFRGFPEFFPQERY